MFGFIYYGIGAIEYIIGGIQNKKANDQSFKDTYNPKYNTYSDIKGIKRDAITGHPVVFEKDYKTGDKYLKDIATGNKTNITKSEGLASKNINDGKTVYKLSNEFVGDKYPVDNKICVGVRYYDKKTNEEYVIRELTYSTFRSLECKARFFMNTKTGMLVRLTDNEQKRTEHNPIDMEEKNNFIKTFNEKQSKNDSPKFYNYARIIKNDDL